MRDDENTTKRLLVHLVEAVQAVREDIQRVRQEVRSSLNQGSLSALPTKDDSAAGDHAGSSEGGGVRTGEGAEEALAEEDGIGPEPPPPNGGEGGSSNPHSEDPDPAPGGEPSLRCEFFGFLAQDGTLRFTAKDPNACGQVLARLRPAKRRFLQDRGLLEKAEDANE